MVPVYESRFEVGESSVQPKPIDLSMYSKNSVTSFRTLALNYISSSLAPSTGVFPEEKLNDPYYFSWSLMVKMFLEGSHQFGFMTGETLRPPLGDAHKLYLKR